ncbi:hypothetical protein WA1_04800 [Scytonema hofmannii PCC 7110]|uniref:Uncharacterized protein n=1 Tax=Scytonema hofmannii PCC 7110 TaxID=128403 RepID=A0A139WZF4_9CYAN|nr:hypothetical protein [Scytonema hofmannii]KYC37831.1 hypothetical protein WA1_04800 [Scytonema hofmannii PCC 7110]
MKFVTRTTLALLLGTTTFLSTSFLPNTSARAVPAMGWRSSAIPYPPSDCSNIAAKVMERMGFGTTKEGTFIKAFTGKTGVLVFCNPSTQRFTGACGGSSLVTMFVTSESSEERDQVQATISKKLFDLGAPACW